MPPVTFLLVDDLEENLLSLEALLRRDDLELLKARSGDQALELLLRHDVALALVDVQMPGLDGFQLAELMRGNERTKRVPIIFVTAGSTDGRRQFRGYEAGAVDFLQKPIEPHVLRSKADVFFELQRQRQQIAAQHKHAREEQDVVLREVNHRIKNLFSVTAGLISLSARSSGSVEELASDLGARLQALARAHDLTLPDLSDDRPTERSTTIVELMTAILAPHEHERASRIAISGHDVTVSNKALTLLALLLHELTTNAAKYGALSSVSGRLAIEVALTGNDVHVTWVETGSETPVEKSAREGFGTTLEKAALKGLGGTMSREWGKDGLSLSLRIPVGNLSN